MSYTRTDDDGNVTVVYEPGDKVVVNGGEEGTIELWDETLDIARWTSVQGRVLNTTTAHITGLRIEQRDHVLDTQLDELAPVDWQLQAPTANNPAPGDGLVQLASEETSAE